MISFLSWGTFWFYIFNAHTSQGVRIFDNIIPMPSTLVTQQELFVKSKTCMLIPDQGPCRGKINMWYFDPRETNCSSFIWGGCQGNGNRFDSFSECWSSCMSRPGPQKYRPRYCSLSFDYGFCFGSVHRWYYDSAWKVCKSTVYSGCGGNKNNFYNLEQCEQICRFGNMPITTQMSDIARTRKMIIVNPYNTTPKRGLEQVVEVTTNETTTTTATTQ